MALETFRLQYTSNSSDVYRIDFRHFLDEQIPRQTLGQTNINFSVLGVPYGTGPAVSQPSIWTVNCALENKVTTHALKNSVSYNEVRLLKEMYSAWDNDRANGLAAKCVLTDGLMSFGSSYVADVWFSEPPVYSLMASYANNYINVVLGLTEV